MKKVEVTNPDKIMFPEEDIRKLDIIEYYSNVSKFMLPFLKGRLLTFQRFPDGIKKEGFYQKNASEYFPSWIKTKKDKGTEYVICNDKDTLIYLTNQGTIVFHTWLSKVQNLDIPDKLIFDLDPPKRSDFKKVVESAFILKDILEGVGLRPYVMFTGSSGLHVAVPIKEEGNFDEVRQIAMEIGKIAIKDNEENLTMEQRIEKRGKRIYIDILRNSRGQHSVCPYSLRANSRGYIASPLSWGDLKKFNKDNYKMKNIKIKNPWRNFFKDKKPLKTAVKKL